MTLMTPCISPGSHFYFRAMIILLYVTQDTRWWQAKTSLTIFRNRREWSRNLIEVYKNLNGTNKVSLVTFLPSQHISRTRDHKWWLSEKQLVWSAWKHIFSLRFTWRGQLKGQNQALLLCKNFESCSFQVKAVKMKLPPRAAICHGRFHTTHSCRGAEGCSWSASPAQINRFQRCDTEIQI